MEISYFSSEYAPWVLYLIATPCEFYYLKYPERIFYPQLPPPVSSQYSSLPVEVDLGVVAVLWLSGIASGKCAEEGVGQKAGYLVLR